MARNVVTALVVLLLVSVPLTGGSLQTGFGRAPSWVYDFFPFDVPGADFTMLEGINNHNDIVGATHVEPSTNQAFVISAGVFSQFAVPGAATTIPLDINDGGVIVGRCDNCELNTYTGTHGFLYLNGSFTTAPFERNTTWGRATGVNQQGHLVGWFDEQFIDPPFGQHTRRTSYINGQYFPDVQLAGVNDAGHVVSAWELSPDLSAGAFLHTNTATTRIVLSFQPDAIAQPEDVNNLDTVAGWYLHDFGNTQPAYRGFVWANGKSVSINYPGAFTTLVNGINDAGVIVGTYGTDETPRHGFVAVPRSPVTVTVNGAAAPVTIARTQPLRVDVAFQAPPAGPLSPAELYVGVISPYGVFWLDPSGRFLPTPTRVFAGALAGFGATPAINLPAASALPAATYTWFAIVDDDSNGVPDGAFYDLLQVTIR